MKLDSSTTLDIHELNDLHDAGNQLVKLPLKLTKAASSEDLRLAKRHLDQTQGHVRPLQRAFALLPRS